MPDAANWRLWALFFRMTAQMEGLKGRHMTAQGNALGTVP
jgi:hypothetical protein